MKDQIKLAKMKLEQQLMAFPEFMEYLGLIALEKSFDKGDEDRPIDKPKLALKTDWRTGPKRYSNLNKELREPARELVISVLNQEIKVSSYVLMSLLRKNFKSLRGKTFNLPLLLGRKWMEENGIKVEKKWYTKENDNV